MPQTWYAPSKDIAGRGTYQTALAGWLQRQRESRTQFTAAEEPLQQAVQMFQPGGGYGRGQETLLREEARRAGAEATAQQVATGMSSGSLATGTGLRIKRDLATGLAGVQDVRTQFLTQALQALSGMRGTQAQTTAAAVDPTYAPYMGYMAARHGQATGLSGAAMARDVRAPSPAKAPDTFWQKSKPQSFSVPRF